MAAGYKVGIHNNSSGNTTVARATGGDTINGAAKNIVLPAGQRCNFRVNAAANGYLIENATGGLFLDPTDPSKQAKLDLSGVTTGTVITLTPPAAGGTLITSSSLTAANGCSLALIGASQTAAASQSIDFTSASYAAAFDGTYDEVEFHLSGVTTTSDALIFRGIVGTGVGPTYHTGGTDYGWAGNRSDEAGNNAFGAATSAYMSLSGEGTVGNAATRSVNGIVRMFNPSNTALHKMILWELQHISDAGVVNRVTGSARYIATTAWTAFRFHFGTFGVNTIAAGKFTCFGVKKA